MSVTGDNENQNDSTFALNLSSPQNATFAVGGASATGTILELPGLAITASVSTLAEGDTPGASSVRFSVTISEAQTAPITVPFAVASQGATIHGTVPASVTIDAGATAAPAVTVAIVGNTRDSTDGTLTATITNPDDTRYALATRTAVVTITDDDDPPLLAIADASGSETAGEVVFNVTLDAASDRTVTVAYTTADGTGPNAATVADGHYTATSGTLTFAPGEQSQAVTVPVTGDTENQVANTFALNLSSPVNATFATDGASATGTILELPGLSLSASVSTLAEGDAPGANSVRFSVTISEAQTAPITVPFAVASQGATIHGTVPASVTIDAGATAAPAVTVAIVGNTRDGADGTLTATITNPDDTRYAIATRTAVVTITDDDDPPMLAVADASGSETAGQVVFNVTLDAASDLTVTVAYTTADGTGPNAATVADGHYTATSGTLTFAPGEQTQAITVPVTGDAEDQLNNNFTINLSSPANATVAPNASSATGTILELIELALSTAGNVTSVAEGAAVQFVITASASQAAALSIPVAVTLNRTSEFAFDGTPPGTVELAAGAVTVTFAVAIADNNVDEADSDFSVTISDPDQAGTPDDSYTLAAGANSLTIAITDNDAAPVLTIADSEAQESAGEMVFAVTLSAVSRQVVTVRYQTADGPARGSGGAGGFEAPATAGEEYTATSGLLTIAPGGNSATITVPLLRDADSLQEVFQVQLSNPEHATLGTPSVANGTILEGLEEDDIQQLNQTILPVVAANLSYQAADFIRTRAEDAFAPPLGTNGYSTNALASSGAYSANGRTTASNYAANGHSSAGLTTGMGAHSSGGLASNTNAHSGKGHSSGSLVAGTSSDSANGQSPNGFTARTNASSFNGRATANNYATNGLTIKGATPGQFLYNELRQALTSRQAGSPHQTSYTRPTIGLEDISFTYNLSALRNRNSTGAPNQLAHSLASSNGTPNHTAHSLANRDGASNHSPLEGESKQAQPVLVGGPVRLSTHYSATPNPPPPTCSPAGCALVSQTPPQGGSDNTVPASGFSNITLWGRGFRNRLAVTDELTFDGDLTGAAIGIDTVVNNNILLGLSFNQATAEMEWEGIRDLRGNHKTEVTGFHPYFAWHLGAGHQLWGTLGRYTGDITITDADRPDFLDRREVEINSYAAGIRGRIWQGSNVDLSFISDVAATDAHETDHDSAEVEAARFRLGLDLRHRRQISAAGNMLTGNAELTWRADRGDGLSGDGLEVGGGMALDFPTLGLQVDLKARYLASYSDKVDEWSLSGGLAWSPTGGPRGLTLSFKPHWGNTASNRHHLWHTAPGTPNAPGSLGNLYGAGNGLGLYGGGPQGNQYAASQYRNAQGQSGGGQYGNGQGQGGGQYGHGMTSQYANGPGSGTPTGQYATNQYGNNASGGQSGASAQGGQYGHQAAANKAYYTLDLQYGIPVLNRQELLNLYLRTTTHQYGRDTAAGLNFTRGYFSTGLELLNSPNTSTDTEHRGFIKYERDF